MGIIQLKVNINIYNWAFRRIIIYYSLRHKWESTPYDLRGNFCQVSSTRRAQKKRGAVFTHYKAIYSEDLMNWTQTRQLVALPRQGGKQEAAERNNDLQGKPWSLHSRCPLVFSTEKVFSCILYLMGLCSNLQKTGVWVTVWQHCTG